ncbi:MAG TPA: hypothetical protein VKP78_10695 [bacterium]|nr:hypothetical protein [bacterium]
MGKNTFDIIILNGRPASGKSEVIDYIKKASPQERAERFHIAEFDDIDDFPMLWKWFEEDAILEKILNKPRMHTDKEGYFFHEYQWHLLIEEISLEYEKRLRDIDNYHDKYTTLIEFSRGSEHGGYQEAYQHLSDQILERAAIFYIDVSFQESLRKNRKRFNPNKPDSILEHGLPDEKLKKMYGEVDWKEFSGDDPEYINIKGQKVPYIVLDNEDDITTERGEELGEALDSLLPKLWKLRQ